MTIVHVHAPHVATGPEGITHNVRNVTRELARRGARVRLDTQDVTLEDLNRRAQLARSALAARRLVRAALRRPTTELVHVHASIAATAMGSAAPSRMDPRVIVHLWNAIYDRREVLAPLPARARLEHRLFNGPRAARAGLRRARTILVSSRYQADQLKHLGLSAAVRIVPNGVDTERFKPSAAERERARASLAPDGLPLILYYGHLSPWKGADVLIRALPAVFAARPDTRALLSATGYGPGRERLRHQMADLGIADRVQLTGPADAATMLAAADVVVVPQVAPVGTACFPNVLLEALASGTPVVATGTGCLPELVQHGRTGLLARPGDATALAACIRRLLEDSDLAARLGRAARASAVSRYAWPVVVDRLAAVYHELGVEMPVPLPRRAPAGVAA